ncbi:MAG: 6-carboxytetrahydropterin synthase QueD [Ruminococcus sp.]|nr:6-carboxytetrahydropterin synthase QueD [Ruminococcus sp.]
MYGLKTSAAFDSAHFLKGYNGKCSNIHGHRWTVEVEVRSEKLIAEGEKRGMIIDFGDIKKAVRALADSLDHTLIYESGSLKKKTLEAMAEEGFKLTEVPFRPTAENFAKYFFDKLRSEGLPVSRVTVYETPDNCAFYGEDCI